VGWWRSSPGTLWRQTAPIASSTLRAIWGLLVSSPGWDLAWRSAVEVLLAALLVRPLTARIRAEERLPHSEFRGEYEAYSAHVGVTSRAFLAPSGITRIAAALAEAVGADGLRWYEPGRILTRFGQSSR
jgi:hypothetical protein